MRNSIQDAIGSTIADMRSVGLKVSFTKKELDKLDIKIVHSSVSPINIKAIRSLIKDNLEH